MPQADTSHTLSSTASTTTFPLVSPQTHALLDEIVAGLDPRANTFEQIFTRYKHVLERHRLDPAHDQEGYACLLKLAMQRGATWKDKWRSAQQALPNTPAMPSLTLLRKKLDSLDASSAVNASSPSVRPRHALLPHSQSYPMTSTPVRSYGHQRAPSDVYDPPTTPPPARARHVAFLSPQSTSPYTPIITDGHIGALETPKPFQTLDVDPLILAADAFCRETLLIRFFDRWSSRLESYRLLERKTAQIRNKLLVKRALAIWRLRLKLVDSVLGPKADAWRAATLKRAAWTQWQDRFQHAQRARWEGQMLAGLEAMRQVREERILVAAWEIWRNKATEAKADRFRLHALLRPAFERWRSANRHVARLEHLGRLYQDDKEADLLYGSLQRWHHKAALSFAERQVAVRRDHARLKSALETWMARLSNRAMADQFYIDNLLKAVLSAWKTRRRKQLMLQAAAERADKQRVAGIAARYFHIWALQAKAIVFVRGTVDARLQRNALHAWLIRCHTVAVEYQDRADDFREGKDLNVARGCLRVWAQKAHARVQVDYAADQMHKETVLRKALTRWRQKVSAVQVNLRKADVARDFFVCRRVWVHWLMKSIESKGERLLAVRQKDALKGAFQAWRVKTCTRLAENAMVDDFRSHVHLRLAQTALQKWVSRVVENRSRLMEVDQRRDAALIRTAFAHWQTAAEAQFELHSLADSFLDVKAEEHKRKAFNKWLRKARWNWQARERAEEERRAERQRVLEKAFGVWRKKLRHARLSRSLFQFTMVKNEMLLEDAFLRWKRRTKILPALEMERSSLLRRTWSQWRGALPLRQATNQADHFYTQRLLADAVSKWKQVTKATRARRAAERVVSVTSGMHLTSSSRFRARSSTALRRLTGSRSIKPTPSASPSVRPLRTSEAPPRSSAQAAIRARIAKTLLAARSSSSSSSDFTDF